MRHQPRNHTTRIPVSWRSDASRAFTLIELLVVVTIIVVLLALLTPAVDRAIYQAEMLRCMTNRRLLATGSHAYAFDNKRFYPNRDLPTNPTVYNGIQAHKLTHVYDTQSGVGSFDLRPMLRPYVPINKTFNDVFCEPVDYEKDDATGGSKTTTHLYTSTFYWAGWQYTGPGSGPGMHKVGDRFTFSGNGREQHLSVLAGDIDCREVGAAYSSHPDNMYLVFTKYQDYPYPFGGLVTSSGWGRAAPGALGDSLVPASPYRDPLDLTFAYDDGSTVRVDHVEYDDPGPYWGDTRMTMIPNFNWLNNGGGGQNQVPREQ